MTAKEWKEKGRAVAEAEAVPLPLPSGMVIRARRPGPLQYAAWGKLPLMLASTMDGKGEDLSDDEAVELAGYIRDLLIYCCVEPRISDTPQGDGEISPRDVPEEDWREIVAWAMRLKEAKELRPFRPRGNDAGSDRSGESVARAAVGADGDRGPGAGAGVRPGGDEEGTGPGPRRG